MDAMFQQASAFNRDIGVEHGASDFYVMDVYFASAFRHFELEHRKSDYHVCYVFPLLRSTTTLGLEHSK